LLKGFQGHVTTANDLMAKACISTTWRQGSLLLLCILETKQV